MQTSHAESKKQKEGKKRKTEKHSVVKAVRAFSRNKTSKDRSKSSSFVSQEMFRVSGSANFESPTARVSNSDDYRFDPEGNSCASSHIDPPQREVPFSRAHESSKEKQS
jgi:hypothetical protein